MQSQPKQMETDVYSLHELLTNIQAAIETSPFASVWVRAEIVKMNLYRTGHCYVDLVEKQENVVKAKVDGIIWKSRYQYITQKFQNATGSPIEDGMQLQLKVAVKLDPYYGFSLIINDIDPDYNLGQVAQEKRLTLQRLQNEGLLHRNQSLPMPQLLQRIAIISVETGKGYNDFMSQLERYKSRFTVVSKLFPSILQGNGAPEAICGALRRIKTRVHLYDAVFILRGGGSDLELACYNNYALARDIALFPIPVITGIGHELDETASQMVAAKGCDTPTDAAIFLLNRFEDFEKTVNNLTENIANKAKNTLQSHQSQLNHHALQISNGFKTKLRLQEQQIAIFSKQIGNKAVINIKNEAERLQQIIDTLSEKPFALLENESNKLENFAKHLKLADLNQKRILEMGYSITTDKNGKLVRDIAQINEGDVIDTQTATGHFRSKVLNKIEENHG